MIDLFAELRLIVGALDADDRSISTVSRDGLIALKRLRASGQDQEDIDKLTDAT